jgi:SnoaL-like domain
MARRLAGALAAHDIDAVVNLLANDIRITMPPLPAIWQGQERAAEFLTEVAFRLVPEARFVETRANRQPALAVYTRDQANGLWRGSGLLVITVRDDQIVGLTRFESHALRPFGLPRILPDDDPPGTSSAYPYRVAPGRSGGASLPGEDRSAEAAQG